MDNIISDNTFSCPPDRRSEFENQMDRLAQIANAYNFFEQPVRLYFFGDEKSGVRFRVDCSDTADRERIENALRKYKEQILMA